MNLLKVECGQLSKTILNSENFVKDNDLVYIPTSITGCSPVKSVVYVKVIL